MKKETKNLVLRALIGVAASLVIVGAMGLITESQGNGTLMEQASGIKGSETVMTVNGEDVTAEEYLYMTAVQAQSLASYGITDLSLELGEGMTAADYVAAQAESQLVADAVLRGWAKEMGVSLTEEDKVALQAQKDAYGDAATFAQMLQMVGTSEAVFDSVISQELLYNHLYDLYCAEGGAQRPDDAALEALAQEHKLMTAKMLVLDAAAENAEAKMADYAAQLAVAENRDELLATFAAELACDGTAQTYDCCHSSPVNDALMALAVGEVSGVVEADGALYIILRTDLNMETVAYVHFSEEYNTRVNSAVVEYNDKVLSQLDMAAFYTQYAQLQQNLYATMMQG